MKPLPCPPEQWPAFSRLLDEVLALPVDRRPAWLAGLQGEDATLRDALAAVLQGASPQTTADFLTSPQWPARRSTDGPGAPAGAGPQAGQRIGPYELLRELGRGGMGVVWLARRCDGAYEREVALKLPHAHLLVGAVRDRFLRERDFLATLTHPNIARFYDAGLGADGQPYLALEAVEGEPITDWARHQRLALAARLALFQQVLGAVEHAHGKLIAHRDLKPANVLVTAAGEVRLLDFGIAKLLEPEAATDGLGAAESSDARSASGQTPLTPLTRAEQRLATPAYAAPEQIAGAPVTAATDVYALGAMLYELLTGQTPHDTLGASASRPGALRAAYEHATRGTPAAEVPLASTRASDAHADTLGLSRRALARALEGDLDAILAKALQREPAQRYVSVAALADDLRRCAQGRPIVARRITRWVRAGKFVRRHRLGVATAALLAASVGLGVAGVAWQGQKAQAQARRAEAVKEFLLGVFTASDPRIASGTPRGQITAKALLDASVDKIEARFAGDPELQIELLRTAADVYRELEEEEAYQRLQARQVELTLQHFGPLHENVLNARVEAAVMAERRGDLAACRQALQDADAPIREAGQDRSELRAQWWLNRATCARDQADAVPQREAALAEALRLYEQVAPVSRGHVTVLAELATEHANQGRHAEALATNQRAIALAETVPDRNDAELQTLYGNVALSLQQTGDLAGAEAAFARSAEIAARTSGPQSRTAWVPASRRARTAHLTGAREKANALFADVLAVLPEGDTTDPDVLTVRETYAAMLCAEGRPAPAVPILEQIEKVLSDSGTTEFMLRRVRRTLADAYDRNGQWAPARRQFELALADFEAHDPPSGQPMISMRERWGRFLLDRGELSAAQAQFERAVQDAKNPRWTHVALAQAGLARLALARGDLPQAASLSQQALATWDQLQGYKDVRMEPYLWRVRAAVLARRPETAAEARALREKALAASQRYDAPESKTVKDPDYIGL